MRYQRCLQLSLRINHQTSWQSLENVSFLFLVLLSLPPPAPPLVQLLFLAFFLSFHLLIMVFWQLCVARGLFILPEYFCVHFLQSEERGTLTACWSFSFFFAGHIQHHLRHLRLRRLRERERTQRDCIVCPKSCSILQRSLLRLLFASTLWSRYGKHSRCRPAASWTAYMEWVLVQANLPVRG